MSRHAASFHRAAWAVLLLALACNRRESAAGAAASAPALPASVAPATSAASTQPAPAAGSFDACLVGAWKTSSVDLKVEQLSAQGGAGMAMSIAGTGATVLDFDRMSEIKATTGPVSFDFRYSGKAGGTLSTPSPGKLAAERTDYAGLRVTANMKLPGTASVPMFKDTPIADLVKMAEGIAAGVDEAVPALPKAPVPSKGIDTAPVFSSSGYTCTPEKLVLIGEQGHVTWTFLRAAP